MFNKKPEKDLEKELSVLKKRADKLEKELERLERVEKSLAQQEIVLAKKITDMNMLEEELKKLVPKKDMDELKKELKKFDEHESALIENSRFIRELTNELGKVKESHRITRSHVMDEKHVKKSECNEKCDLVKDAIKEMEHIRKTHKKKAEHGDIASLRKELHDRLAQIEYQNKLLIKYLKRLEESME